MLFPGPAALVGADELGRRQDVPGDRLLQLRHRRAGGKVKLRVEGIEAEDVPRRVVCRSEPEPTALPEPPRRGSGLFKSIHRRFRPDASNPPLATPVLVDAQGGGNRV